MDGVSAPLVIGHRGASGHRPEHTALAYQLAWRSGADSVEPDVVCTRDGVLVCRHDLDLSATTDVADRPEFAHRRRTMHVDGVPVEGFFVQDFLLEELRVLRARERWPRKRPTSAMYDDLLPILTLEELLDLRAEESARAGRQLGVHIELKHPELFASMGMPLRESLVAILRERRLDSALGPATVMAFEPRILQQLRRDLDVELVQLVGRRQGLGSRRFHRIGEYATTVGLDKHLVLPHDATGAVGEPGPGVQAAFRAGLDVLVWTLRSENRHLPAGLRDDGSPHDHGDASGEVLRMLDLGVDALMTDFPEVAVRARHHRVDPVAL